MLLFKVSAAEHCCISAMASTMLFSQSAQESMKSMGLGQGHVSLDTWECQLPKHRPVRTATSSSKVRGGSRTTSKSVSISKSSLSLDMSLLRENEPAHEDAGELGCETPKSNEHRIPAVDIDACPPAPKKPRGMGRLVLACATECENSDIRQPDLGLQLSPCYLF